MNRFTVNPTEGPARRNRFTVDTEPTVNRFSVASARRGTAKRPPARAPGRIYSGGRIMDILDTLAAPGYATAGLIRGAARAGAEHGPGATLGDFAEYLFSRRAVREAWKGVGERASNREAIAEVYPEFAAAHPTITSALGLGADVLTDPANIFALPVLPLLKVGGKGAGAVARRVAPEATERLLESRYVTGAIRKARDVRDLAASAISRRHKKAAQEFERLAKEVAETQGKQVPVATSRRPAAAGVGRLTRAELKRRAEASADWGGNEPSVEHALEQLHQRMGVNPEVVFPEEVGRTLPKERQGVSFDVPKPGERVTPADVQNLSAALGESSSLSGQAATPAAARREVLDYARLLGLDTKKLEQMADLHRTLGRAYQERIIASGMKPAEELAEMQARGGYVRRSYTRFDRTTDDIIEELRAAGKIEEAARLKRAVENALPMSAGDRANIATRKFMARAELAPEARRALGEVTQSAPRTLQQGEALAEVLPRFEMYDALSRDARVARKAASEAEEGDLLRQGWIPMPEQEVAPSGSWGRLAGMYVHPVLHDALVGRPLRARRIVSDVLQGRPRNAAREILRNIRSLAAPAIERERPPAHGFWGIESESLGLLKRGWTLWNAAGQARNVLGNMVAMHAFGGVPAPLAPYFYIRGFMHALKEDDLFERAMALMPSMADPAVAGELRASLQALRGTARGRLSRMGPLGRKALTLPGRAWQLNEVAAKLGTAEYLMRKGLPEAAARALGRGLPEDAAMQLAEKALYHYGDVRRITEKLRTYGPVPFPTYTFKTIEQFAKTAVTKPQRINVYTRGAQAIETAGGAPRERIEAERALSPRYEEANLPVRLPVADRAGRTLWWRSGYGLPWGSLAGLADMAQTFGSGELIAPAAPALQASPWVNRNAFGTRIYDPENDTAGQIAGAVGKHLASSYLPMGYTARAGLESMLARSPEAKARALTLPEFAARSLGVSLRVSEPKRDVRSRFLDLQAEARRLATWARRHKRAAGGELSKGDQARVDHRRAELRAKAFALRAAGGMARGGQDEEFESGIDALLQQLAQVE